MKSRVQRQRAWTPGSVQLYALAGMPEVKTGDDIAGHIVSAGRKTRLRFQHGDVLVIAQKIVSKAEGQTIRLSDVKPARKAVRLAATLGKDPRFVEIVLRESKCIVRKSARALIVETHHGFVCANAGVDRSNVPGDDVVTVLPRDSDRSANELSASLRKHTGKRIGVVISDTFGRAWRLGLINVAIGASGVPVLSDLRGKRDRCGKILQATVVAIVDELAAAAGLLMGKAEGVPVILIRGFLYKPASAPATGVIRPRKEDLFR